MAVPIRIQSRVPEPDSWVEIDHPVIKFSHRWTIKNFITYLKTSMICPDDTLKSPPLSSGQPGDDLVWRVQVVREKWTRYNYNGITISVILQSATESQVPAKVSCCILDGNNQKVKSPNTYYNKWSLYKPDGVPQILWTIEDREFRDSSKPLLHDGNLTLYWEITVHKIHKPQITAEKKHVFSPAVSDKEKLGHDLGFLFKDGLFSDVTIVAGGKEFKAHKNILSARSPVFRRMFEHDMRESTENRVTIEDISPEAVEEMLTFIYSGQAPNLKKMPVDLLRAAEKYDLKQLKAWSEKELADQLTPENVMETMVLADQHSATELKTVCMDLFTARAGEVVKTEGWESLTQIDMQLLKGLVLQLAKK